MKIAWEIPTGRGDTSWLFTTLAEGLRFACTSQIFNYCQIRHFIAIEIIENKWTVTLGLFSRKNSFMVGLFINNKKRTIHVVHETEILGNRVLLGGKQLALKA